MKEFQRAFIVEGSESDKIWHHGYHRFYPWFLEHFRRENINVLEIGIHETESLKLWSGYFQHVNLHGIDIDKKEFEEKSVTMHQVDQSNSKDLDKFVRSIGVHFDLILDDGSHAPCHQMLTLKKFWKILNPGGVYIIEDIETSYWGRSDIYGYEFNANRYNVIEPFKKLVDVVNAEFSKKASNDKYLKLLEDEVEMVSFGQNCIIVVKKDFDSFAEYYSRSYKHEDKVNKRSLRNRIFRKFRRLIS